MTISLSRRLICLCILTLVAAGSGCTWVGGLANAWPGGGPAEPTDEQGGSASAVVEADGTYKPSRESPEMRRARLGIRMPEPTEDSKKASQEESKPREPAAVTATVASKSPMHTEPVQREGYSRKAELADILANQDTLFAILAEQPQGTVPAKITARAEGISEDYRALIEREPTNLEARILYGKFLRRVGEHEAAANQFRRVEELDSGIPVVKQQLANHYAETGRPLEALAYLTAARQLAPHEAVYAYQIGELIAFYRKEMAEDGDLTAEALDALMQASFKRASQLEPGNRGFRVRFAESFYDVASPDWTAALAAWNQVERRVNPAAEPLLAEAVRVHQARALDELGRSAEARQLLTQVNSLQLQASRERVLRIAESGK
jgi:tetratricopeptide (TPR) repeat protein